MKNLCIFSFLLLSSSSLFAQDQLQKILKDPDVLWASEYLFDIDPMVNREKNNAKGFGEVSGNLLKFVAQPAKKEGNIYTSHYSMDYRYGLVKILIDNRDVITIYKDKYLKKSYSKTEAAKINTYIDTIKSSSPPNSDKGLETVENEIHPGSFIGLRQYGVIYFNKKDGQFHAKAISIAPLYKQNPSLKNSVIKPLFWVKIEESNKTELDSENIQWASRIFNHVANVDETAPKEQNQGFFESWNLILENIRSDANKYRCYNTYDILGSNLLSEEELYRTVNYIDTIVGFDPETFEEKVDVKVSKKDSEEIKDVRIVQDWLWDNKKKQLFVRYLGYAPRMKSYDVPSSFSEGPLFYLRMPGVK
jgi:hypothetical protein